MSQLFSQVLGGLGKFGGDMGSVLGALKGPLAIAQMISSYQQNADRKKATDTEMYYMKHPEALANLQKQYQQPLSSGLTAGVGNIVQAQMAERGLNQAPGIYSEVLAQSLAPYQQQEQQMALNMALQQMGLPGDILSGLRSSGGAGGNVGGLAGLLQQLQPASSNQPFGSVGGVSDPNLGTPSYMPNYGDINMPGSAPFDPTQSLPGS